MADEKDLKQENLTSDSSEVDVNTDYIAAIKELKQNSVDRSKYEELRAENKKLLESIVNGQYEAKVEEAPVVDIEKLRNELFNEEHDNLSYVTKALELRDALMANGDPDPFLPYGKQIVPTDEDIACANKVANVLKECVEYAQGDSAVFTNELQRRTIDVRIR